MTIATLIAGRRLDESLLAGALARIAGARMSRWIDRGDAVDLEIGAPASTIRAAFEGWENVDIIVHGKGSREKALLVADMDSTMIGQECIDELADFAGIKAKIAAITERAMQGELDFETALRDRVLLLRGVEEAAIGQCLAERIHVNPGAQTLVRTMRSRGAATLLVSGGFTAFAGPIAERLGFEQVEANSLAIDGGRLSGAIDGRIIDAAFKASALVETRDRLGLDVEAVLAIGDGANDALMIEAAGLGVAYRAKPTLAAVADARLDHHGLDALLWAQAIPRSQWVAA